MRIITANLNGIRSAVNKGFLDWIPHQNADFICLQELKAQAANMTQVMQAPHGYHGYFHYAEKKGYSGVGVYARRQPTRSSKARRPKIVPRAATLNSCTTACRSFRCTCLRAPAAITARRQSMFMERFFLDQLALRP